MRDVIYRKTVVNYSRNVEYRGDSPPGVTTEFSAINSNNLVKASGRSDIVQGNHVSPTAYNAYRITSRANSFQLKGAWRTATGTGPNGQPYEYRGILKGKAGLTSSSLMRVGMTTGYLPSVPLALYSEARTKALNRALQKKVDLGQSIGEIKSTARMMQSRLLQLVRAYRYARKGDFRNVGNTLFDKKGGRIKEAANSWLEYQFGWKPLMNDIYNGRQAIMDALNKDKGLFHVSATAVNDKYVPPLSGSYDYISSDCTQGVQVGLTYRTQESTVAGLNSLGVLNPLALAWELLPLSFVVDWFVSVGDFLSGLGAAWGLSFHSGYETAWTRGKFHIEKYLPPYYSKSWESGEFPSWNIDNFAMKRTALQGSPPPGFYFKMRNITSESLAGKIRTILALVVQRA